MDTQVSLDAEVPLSAAGARLLHRGAPQIPLEEAPGGRRLEAGVAARLLEPGGRPAGAGIVDPDRGVLRVWSHQPVKALDREFFRAKVQAALERRRTLSGSGDTDAYRLIHGDGDGLSGIAADRWGDFVVVEAYGRGPALHAGPIELALQELVRPRGIVRKEVADEPGAAAGGGDRVRAAGRGKVAEQVVAGETPPPELVVRENGVPFLVRLLGARQVGLFTDMRDERRRLAGLAAGRRVLNTFAYTGGFSVAAARAGAAEVVSVDVVKKVLEWAKENFRLSGIDPAGHRFVAMDVLEYLKLAERRGWTFDAIVVDPPTFAVSRAGRWSLRRDYPALIGRALAALSPGGYLWLAANAAGLHSADLERWISSAAIAAGRKLAAVARAGQPLDHPAPPGFPRYRYLKVHVLRG